MKALVFDVQRFSLHDGPGIRTTVFFKGCDLRCLWCHNPESQRREPELMLYPEKCTVCGACKRACAAAFTDACRRCGACADVCRAGARTRSGYARDTAELAALVLRDRPFYEQSGGGMTLSGGEPLLQAEAAAGLLRACKEAGVHTAVETAGHVPAAALEVVLPCTDLFLYDIKGIDPALHRRNTGADNALILANARRLAAEAAEVVFRMPYVPGFNDGEAEAAAAFAKSLGRPLELMAYHEIGAGKYAALGRAYPAAAAAPPGPAAMRDLAARLGARYEPTGF